MDYYRRVSTGQQQQPHQDVVPPAPPLPPPKRNSETASRGGLLDRFQGILGGARRSVTGQQSESAQALRSQLSSSPRYGLSKSRSASHRTGLKIRAIDINHARTHAVLAGGKILKTVRVDGANCIEDFNIRSAAVNYAWEATTQDGKKPHRASEDVSAVQRETFDIEDVAWSNGHNFSSYIATAASNGRIMLYDLERPVVEIGRLHEHNRQVHKVDFNPTEGRFLLSGSQDGTVRLWDLRTLRRNVMVCYSRETFPGRSDGVRHTKWSPTDTWTFAMCTDNGTVQRWDTRQNKAPVLKISAHSDTCNSIDWHPDGRHLVSAGKDQNVKVWNMSADRKQKPSYQIRAPKEVQNVRWRPPCFVADGPDSYLKQTTHLATSYKTFPVVHVWDLRRPYMPFREIDHGINSGTTDMLWQSKDILWTVGPEGEFCQTDVHFAQMTINRRPPKSLAHSTTGEFIFFAQPSRPPRSSPEGHTHEFGVDDNRLASSTSPQKKIGRLAISDDSFEDRFLSSSSRRWHSRTPSIRSGRSLISTPPSAEDIAKPVVFLDDVMRDFQDVVPYQTSFSGPYIGSNVQQMFPYLALKYEKALQEHIIAGPHSFSSICTAHAKYLSKTGRTSEANVWILLGRDIALWLQEEGAAFRKESLRGSQGLTLSKVETHLLPLGRASGARRVVSNNSLATEKASGRELSNSKAATPLAQPLRIGNSNDKDPQEDHADVDSMESLPPSDSSGDFSRDDEQVLAKHQDSTQNLQNGWQPSVSAAERRQDLMSQLRTHPRAILDFDNYPDSRPISGSFQTSLHRHDSGESFMMFSTSSESRPRLSKTQSFSSSAAASLSRTQGSWNESDSAMQGSVQRVDSGEEVLSSKGSYPLEDKGQTSKPSIASSISEGHGKISHINPRLDRNVKGKIHTVPTPQDTNNEIALIDGSPLEDLVPRPMSSHHGRLEQPGMVESISLGEPSHPHLSLDDNTWLKVELFGKLLEQYVSSTDAQLASQLFMLCYPVLRPSISQPTTFDSNTTMHHTISSSMCSYLINTTGFSPSAAQDIVTDVHLVLEELGISSNMVETFLATYHEQLLSHRLFSAAASLRQRAYPAFPAVYEQAFQSVDTGLLCTFCNNPLNNPTDKSICETCKRSQAPCAVCLLQESPYSLPLITPSIKKGKGSRKSSFIAAALPGIIPMPTSPDPKTDEEVEQPSNTMASSNAVSATEKTSKQQTRLLTTCPLCNHSVHTACAFTWFADPVGGGACPVEFCVCDCTTGAYRDEKLAGARLQAEIRRGLARTRSSASSTAGTPTSHTAIGTPPGAAVLPSISIRRDEWDVSQSQAVRGARGALRENSIASTAASDGEIERALASSSGATTPQRQAGRRGGLGGRSGSSRGGSEAGFEGASVGSSLSGSVGTRRVRVVGPGE